MADIVLRGGEIINGEGHPAVSGDVVVDGGTIVSTFSQSTTEANLERSEEHTSELQSQ